MRDVQRTMNNEWPFLQEQLRWAHVIEKVRGFANIPLKIRAKDLWNNYVAKRLAYAYVYTIKYKKNIE